MGKYSPLKEFLAKQGRDHVPMTFKEIESVLSESLPPSKQYPAWWSNNPSNNVMTKEWLAAGYQTESVDIAGEKLVFRRVRKPLASSPVSDGGPADKKGSGKEGLAAARTHPIFGCMKGTLTILPGVDLTQPANPEWGKVYEDD